MYLTIFNWRHYNNNNSNYIHIQWKDSRPMNYASNGEHTEYGFIIICIERSVRLFN